MIRKLIVALLLTFVCVSMQAQAPKYSNEFLNIGVGARALAMSNSNVANVKGVTAGYWNPAGLTNLTGQHEIALMHSEYFAGIAKYDYGSFATRIDRYSVVGFSAIRFAVDDIPNTTNLISNNGTIDYNKITTFSASDFAFVASYARAVVGMKNKYKVDIRYGGNVKIIRRRVGDFANAWGFGLDFGLQYDYQGWKMGAMLRDGTSTFNAWTFNLDDNMKATFLATDNVIPENSVEITLPKLLMGVAKEITFKEKYSLLGEIDIDATFDGKRNVLIRSKLINLDPHLGFEFGYKGFVFVRGGLGNYQTYTDAVGDKVRSFQPNVGLGLKIKDFTIDYALTDIGDQSVALFSNVFSLKFNFNNEDDD